MILNLFFAYYVACAIITLFIESYILKKQGWRLKNRAGYLVFCAIMGFLYVPLVYLIGSMKTPYDNKLNKCDGKCKCKDKK